MAAITFYMLPDTAAGTSHFGSLQDAGTPPATGDSASGWVDATAKNNYSKYFRAVQRAASTFTATVQPDGILDNTNGDCLRSQNSYSGTFASGNWTFSFGVRFNSSLNGDGMKLRLRVFRGPNQDGTSAVELTGATQISGGFQDSTTSAQTVTITWSPGQAFALNNEYLFVELAASTTGVNNLDGASFLLQQGAAYTLLTPNFAAEQPPVELRDGTLLPERVYGSRRAGASAYETAAKLVVPDDPMTNEVAITRTMQPERVYGTRRAGYIAYHIPLPTFLVPDDPMTQEVTTSRGMLPERVYGARRATPAAYHNPFPTFPVTDDLSGLELQLSRTLLHERVYPARRAGNAAYSLPFPGFVVLDAAQDPMGELRGPKLLPDRVERRRLAPPVAYELLPPRPAFPDEPELIPRQSEHPLIVKVRRAAGRAYDWETPLPAFNLDAAPISVVELAIGKLLPERAVRRWAGLTAYEMLSRFVVQDALPVEIPVRLWPDKVLPLRRAGSTAYHLEPFPTPLGPTAVPVELRTGILLPERAWGARRAAVPAYDTASRFQIGDEPEVYARTVLHERVYAVRRAGAAAYAPETMAGALRPVEVQIELQLGRLLPERVTGARRSGAEGYTAAPTVMPIIEEPAQFIRSALPERVYSARRAGPSAYLFPEGIPRAVEPGEINFELVIGKLLPERAPIARRAAPAGFDLATPRFQIGDEPQLVQYQLGYPDRAPGARRASAAAYETLTKFVTPDDVWAWQITLLPERAPGARRAAPAAFQLEVMASPLIDDLLSLKIGWLLPERAAGARRAPAEAYTAAATLFQIPEQPVLTPVGWMMPDRAAGARRAAASAYEPTAALFVTPSDPMLAQVGLLLPERAAGARRAAAVAYEPAATTFVPPSDPMLSQVGWMIPERVYRGRRTATTAYETAQSLPQDEAAEIRLGSLLPERAAGARRAGAEAYAPRVATFVAAPDVSPWGLSLLPDRAPGIRRAAPEAYWIVSLPLVLTPGKVVLGPWVLEAGYLYVPGCEQGVLIVGGAETGTLVVPGSEQGRMP